MPSDKEQLECIKCYNTFWVIRREIDRKVSCPKCGHTGSFNYV